MRGLIRWLMMAAIAVSLVLSSLPGNWAQAADGDGDGSGGGQNNPLVIESSTPANGAAGVATLEYIKVVFSKNVVYMTVRDQNMQCFSLWSGSQRIPAEIIMADDQIEREKRRDVLIKPKQPLQPGTAYRVEIAPEMKSKSGVTLGHKEVINFTMAGAAKTPETAAPVKEQPVSPNTPVSSQPGSPGTAPEDNPATPAGSGTDTEIPAAVGTDTVATAPASTVAEVDEPSPAATSGGNTVWWIALGAAAVVLAVGAWRRMGKK
ncbi:MAG: hypothetical protein GX133_03440 [Syntrophomonadaceae bacterium]|nr:hypothetical protein [Syntrophomonadaceae bacterium]